MKSRLVLWVAPTIFVGAIAHCEQASAQMIPPPARPPIVAAIEGDEITSSIQASPQVGTAKGSAGAGTRAAEARLEPGAGGSVPPGMQSGAGAATGAGGAGGTVMPGAGGAGAVGGQPGAGPDFAAAANALGPGFTTAVESAAATPFAMIGDLAPFTFRAFEGHANASPVPPPVPPPGPPHPPGSRAGSPVLQTVRAFKVTDNQSPRPQDRVFFDFNYYGNVNNTLNRRDLSPITQMNAYSYLLGLEKTFNQGMGSIGVRLPIENLSANSLNHVVATPTSTAMGNLSIFSKYILAENKQTGSLVSAGFAMVMPTGPGRFAGAPYLFGINGVYFQPFLGYIYNKDRWYLQGFTGFNFAANVNDVSMIYNDFGIGYYLKKSQDPREFINAIAPAFEVHVNNPINHRDVFNRFDIAGTPDMVDLTFGLNIQFQRSSVLTLAYVTSVASPRPFDSEAAILFNVYYGRTRASMIPITPPPTL